MHHNRWTREKAIKAQESVACLRVLGSNVECESESILDIRLIYDLQDENSFVLCISKWNIFELISGLAQSKLILH